MAEILAELYPALRTYCPILESLSRQQSFFLLLEDREGFYGGAAGGGKSAALLADSIKFVDVPGYAALLLRRTFPELEGPDGLIFQSHEWLDNTDAKWNEQKHRWTFPKGAVLQFGHVQEESDKTRYQGQAYQFFGFDELTHFTESQYEYIGFTRGRRRSAMKALGIPVRTRAASNPGGIGHAWVKSRFIDQRKPGVAFVPAKLRDNPGLDAEDYEASFEGVDDVLRQQLLEGDWGAFEGMAFRLSPDHIIGPFEQLPVAWSRFESMDHGIGSPTAWLAHAVDYEGNLITFDSYYESDKLPSDHAPVILKKRQGWRTSLCWGDPNSLATRTGSTNRWGDPATIQTEYEERGIAIAKAKNDPRSGYARLRELLKLDPKWRFPDWHPRRGEAGAPRWFIVAKTCPELVTQLRTAPLTPIDHRYAGEMIDPAWEGPHGHALAAARYGASSWPEASLVPPETPDRSERVLSNYQHARAELLREHHRRVENEEQLAIEYEWA